jgi:chloramphenicol 3-O-phosphotransferase
MENDSFLDPCESMLIKRILNVASRYAALKTFIDNNISLIGADRTVRGESLTDAIFYFSGMRFQLSQQYISSDSFLSQMS